ncbi:MAG: cadmium-translocating P-type ATPase [Phycisphaerae bacterium]|nr:cadmium-translocating P-type ATPase [Phycisphaerae bacterium]
MVHDILGVHEHEHDLDGGDEKSVKTLTWRTTLFMVGILVGGLFVILSYVASWLFSGDTDMQGVNFYSDVLALIGAIMLGIPIIIHSIKELLHGHSHMDELVGLAVVAAIASADYRAAGAVAFFLLIGNLIETRTALGARASIESLLRIAPKKANRINADGSEEQIDPRELSTGDIVRVRPGENIPADGVITHGASSVNQANITGESIPVDKVIGDDVFSGTNNESGAIELKVTRAGEDTTLGRVKKLILQAEDTKHPIMRLVDRYAGFYTPTVLMIAAAVLYFNRGNPDAYSRAVAMLVVACPCALVLAVPTAMVASLSCAARLGILIKDVSMLEVASDLTAFVFDKTGTLTTGELSVTQLKPAKGVDGADLLAAAGSVEQMSHHPVARAVVKIAQKAHVDMPKPEKFEEISGLGVIATVDGKNIMVGRRKWLEDKGVNFASMAGEDFAEPEGLSTLYVVRDNAPLGWIGLEDRTRGEAREAMEALRGEGIRELVMITGDRWSVARRVAGEMGCTEVQAEALPADKLELVAAMQAKGHKVAVVGDGVNDAPALAAGDLSIAMGAAGSDVAINSANIALMNTDLKRLPFLVHLSKRTTRVIHQNLIFGVIFILAFMVLAGLGIILPVWGALLHTVGATFVVFNSARLVRAGEDLQISDDKDEETVKPKVEHLAPATA